MKRNNQLTKNLLICGDNFKALDDLVKKGIKADLIYLDPPFFSHRHYEVVWGDEAEVRSFKDRWAGGINVYIEWMKGRVVKMYDVLKDTGSFYLHCDWHANHHLRVMLDEIFDIKNFQNEIVWRRTIGGTSIANRFRTQTDTILSYTKTRTYTFNEQFLKSHLTEEEIYKKFPFIDKERGRYCTDNLANPDYRPNLIYEYKGYKPPKKGWAISLEKMKQWDAEGRLHLPKDKNNRIRRKRFLSEWQGAPVQNLWVDIPPLQSQSGERMGYPTQKPEALLERIIITSSNKDDLVLDPFCGCGTAMIVSHRLGRKWIGIDISPTAISVIEKRLKKVKAIKGQNFDTIGMPTTLSELETLEPREFQNWVINEMKAKHSKKFVSDMGIDGYYDKTIFTDPAGIQVKQSEKIGRNVVDNFETALRRGKYEKGFIIAFSFTRGAHEEVARVKGKGLDIKLVRVEDLLLGKVKI